MVRIVAVIRTGIVHGRGDLSVETLRETIAGTISAEVIIAPFQLADRGKSREWRSPQGAVVNAVHVATDDPVCFRLAEKGELAEFRESCRFLEKCAPDEWATLVRSNGCVFVESGRDVRVHSRRTEMTVYTIPVLQLTKPEVEQTIWRVADALRALVLGEEGQLIWRPGEPGWSEPSLHGGRKPIGSA
jgi:hypothetical protein